MGKFENITEVVSDLMEDGNEVAAKTIVDLASLVVSEEADEIEEVETVLSLSLPTLKEMVGDTDSEDGDDLLGAI